MTRVIVRVVAAVAAVTVAAAAPTPMFVEPTVAVWYRGTPVGVPRQDELAALRALGFTHIVWPMRLGSGLADARRMAGVVGLAVSVRVDPAPLTAENAGRPGALVDVMVKTTTPQSMPALVWRAIAHGARDVAFDAGESSGAGARTGRAGDLAPWVRPAIDITRQVSGNASLLDLSRDGPPIAIETTAGPAAEVVLLGSERAWLLIATNTGAAPAHVVAHLPPAVPSALWVSLIDGEGMSMLAQPGGARWTIDLDPGAASVYVIDKKRSSFHFRISSSVTIFTGPRLASRIGFSIFERSPTTMTANLSVWMYCFAARSMSAAVTA
jgi:hypothetical protein